MTWLQLHLSGFPPPAFAPRLFASGERFLGRVKAWARAQGARCRARLGPRTAGLRRHLRFARADSELAACAFFLLLILLTFLV